MLSRFRAIVYVAVADLVIAIAALVLVAVGRPSDGTCPDGAPTPLHSGWFALAALLAAIVIGLVAGGMRLALPPDQHALRSLVTRAQALCLVTAVVAAVACYIVVAAYACFE